MFNRRLKKVLYHIDLVQILIKYRRIDILPMIEKEEKEEVPQHFGLTVSCN